MLPNKTLIDARELQTNFPYTYGTNLDDFPLHYGNNFNEFGRRGNYCVYFLLNPALQHIKIGFTSDLKSRIRQAQTGSSVRLILLATIAGITSEDAARKVERHWHVAYAHLRLTGEWFRFETDLEEAVKHNRKSLHEQLQLPI